MNMMRCKLKPRLKRSSSCKQSRISRDIPYFGPCVSRPGLCLPGTQNVPFFRMHVKQICGVGVGIYQHLLCSLPTDIINHRYLTSYWLTRNRLLPIVRHCAEAIEKLDWPIYDAYINRSKYRVPRLPISKHQHWVIVELKCIYRSVSALSKLLNCK